MMINSIALGNAVPIKTDTSSRDQLAGDQESLLKPNIVKPVDRAIAAEETDLLSDDLNSTSQLKISRSHSEIGRDETRDERVERWGRMSDIVLYELPQAQINASNLIQGVEESIRSEHPSIMDKEWDFSIDERNNIVVISDQLNKDEEQYLENKLNSSGLNEVLGQLRNTMINLLDSDRGPDGLSDKIGKYDLNSSNFSEIIRFREYNSQTQSEQPSLTLIEDGVSALADQLYERAEDKFKALPLIDVHV